MRESLCPRGRNMRRFDLDHLQFKPIYFYYIILMEHYYYHINEGDASTIFIDTANCSHVAGGGNSFSRSWARGGECRGECLRYCGMQDMFQSIIESMSSMQFNPAFHIRTDEQYMSLSRGVLFEGRLMSDLPGGYSKLCELSAGRCGIDLPGLFS
jgi:hypothetical protein